MPGATPEPAKGTTHSIGTDIFLEGLEYLVVADYYSKYIEIRIHQADAKRTKQQAHNH